MDDLEKIIKKYDVPRPEHLINDKAVDEHLIALKIKSESHKRITKVELIREAIQKISVLKDRVAWLKAAKEYCDTVLNLLAPKSLLDLAIRNESGFQEPIGFFEIRDFIEREFIDGSYRLKRVPNSNSDVLSKASYWLDPLMEKIFGLTMPTNEDIIHLFEEVYPEFQKDFDYSKLKSPFVKDSSHVKKSIFEGASFIYLKKHDISITADAIRKRWGKKQKLMKK